MIRNLSFSISVVAAFFVIVGAVTLQPMLMAGAGVIAGFAAACWGLFVAIGPDVESETDSDPADDELPYVPVDHGRAPVWDTDIWGAVE